MTTASMGVTPSCKLVKQEAKFRQGSQHKGTDGRQYTSLLHVVLLLSEKSILTEPRKMCGIKKKEYMYIYPLSSHKRKGKGCVPSTTAELRI